MVVVLSALVLKERMKNEDAMRTSRYGKSKCNVYTHRTLEKKKVYKNLGNQRLSNILKRNEPRCGSPIQSIRK